MANKKVCFISNRSPGKLVGGVPTHVATSLLTSVFEQYGRTRRTAAKIAGDLARLAMGELDYARYLCEDAVDPENREGPWLFDITGIDNRGVSISFDKGRMGVFVSARIEGEGQARKKLLTINVDFGPEGSSERARDIIAAWGDKADYVLTV